MPAAVAERRRAEAFERRGRQTGASIVAARGGTSSPSPLASHCAAIKRASIARTSLHATTGLDHVGPRPRVRRRRPCNRDLQPLVAPLVAASRRDYLSRAPARRAERSSSASAFWTHHAFLVPALRVARSAGLRIAEPSAVFLDPRYVWISTPARGRSGGLLVLGQRRARGSTTIGRRQTPSSTRRDRRARAMVSEHTHAGGSGSRDLSRCSRSRRGSPAQPPSLAVALVSPPTTALQLPCAAGRH